MDPQISTEARETTPAERASSLRVSVILAATGGFLDAFTYVGHGGVFASAMTGNVVLLGINCLSGDWRKGLRHLPPICAFLVGIAGAQGIKLYFKNRRGITPYTLDPYPLALALEVSVLAVLSFVPRTAPDLLFTIAIAVAASEQAEMFRQVHGISYNSTFTTGNLRTFAESAFLWTVGGRDPKQARVATEFASICSAFLLGAMAGGSSVHYFGNLALWCPVFLLLVVAALVR